MALACGACRGVQVGNPLLVRLCDDLRDVMQPKVTVQSSVAFEGKVWE